MGVIDILGKIGSTLIASVVERGVEISPEKIADFTVEQLEWLSKEGKGESRRLAYKELRKRK